MRTVAWGHSMPPQVMFSISFEPPPTAHSVLGEFPIDKRRSPLSGGYDRLVLNIYTRSAQSVEVVLGRLRWFARPFGGSERPLSVEYAGSEGRVQLPAVSEANASRCFCLPVRLRYDALSPKQLYTIGVRPASGAVVAANKPIPAESSDTLDLYLSAPPVPPEMAVGQSFICLPPLTHPPEFPYHDAQNRSPDWRKVALRKWTLLSIREGLLEFAVENSPIRVRLQWDGASSLPFLAPIIDEPEARALKARYEGRRVWGYGGIGAALVLSQPKEFAVLSFEPLKPARVLRIARLWQPWTHLRLGSSVQIGRHERGIHVHQPLLVQLLPEGKPEAVISENAGNFSKVFQNPTRYAVGFYNLVADGWQFERNYHLQSPLELAKRWNATERRALRTRELVKGIRAEVVAWIFGWPDAYGAKSQLLRLSKWTYSGVEFPAELIFRNGRLVRWQVYELPFIYPKPIATQLVEISAGV